MFQAVSFFLTVMLAVLVHQPSPDTSITRPRLSLPRVAVMMLLANIGGMLCMYASEQWVARPFALCCSDVAGLSYPGQMGVCYPWLAPRCTVALGLVVGCMGAFAATRMSWRRWRRRPVLF